MSVTPATPDDGAGGLQVLGKPEQLSDLLRLFLKKEKGAGKGGP